MLCLCTKKQPFVLMVEVPTKIGCIRIKKSKSILCAKDCPKTTDESIKYVGAEKTTVKNCAKLRKLSKRMEGSEKAVSKASAAVSKCLTEKYPLGVQHYFRFAGNIALKHCHKEGKRLADKQKEKKEKVKSLKKELKIK